MVGGFIISDGTVNDLTKCIFVDVRIELGQAIRDFIKATGTPIDQVVLNQYMLPGYCCGQKEMIGQSAAEVLLYEDGAEARRKAAFSELSRLSDQMRYRLRTIYTPEALALLDHSDIVEAAEKWFGGGVDEPLVTALRKAFEFADLLA